MPHIWSHQRDLGTPGGFLLQLLQPCRQRGGELLISGDTQLRLQGPPGSTVQKPPSPSGKGRWGTWGGEGQ